MCAVWSAAKILVAGTVFLLLTDVFVIQARSGKGLKGGSRENGKNKALLKEKTSTEESEHEKLPSEKPNLQNHSPKAKIYNLKLNPSNKIMALFRRLSECKKVQEKKCHVRNQDCCQKLYCAPDESWETSGAGTCRQCVSQMGKCDANVACCSKVCKDNGVGYGQCEPSKEDKKEEKAKKKANKKAIKPKAKIFHWKQKPSQKIETALMKLEECKQKKTECHVHNQDCCTDLYCAPNEAWQTSEKGICQTCAKYMNKCDADVACCSKVCEDKGLGYGQCGRSNKEHEEAERRDDETVHKLERKNYHDGVQEQSAKLSKAKKEAKMQRKMG